MKSQSDQDYFNQLWDTFAESMQKSATEEYK